MSSPTVTVTRVNWSLTHRLQEGQNGSWNIMAEIVLTWLGRTVDGSEIPNNHLGCIKPVVNNGINYQPQLVSRISSINSINNPLKIKQRKPGWSWSLLMLQEPLGWMEDPVNGLVNVSRDVGKTCSLKASDSSLASLLWRKYLLSSVPKLRENKVSKS